MGTQVPSNPPSLTICSPPNGQINANDNFRTIFAHHEAQVPTNKKRIHILLNNRKRGPKKKLRFPLRYKSICDSVITNKEPVHFQLSLKAQILFFNKLPAFTTRTTTKQLIHNKLSTNPSSCPLQASKDKLIMSKDPNNSQNRGSFLLSTNGCKSDNALFVESVDRGKEERPSKDLKRFCTLYSRLVKPSSVSIPPISNNESFGEETSDLIMKRLKAGRKSEQDSPKKGIFENTKQRRNAHLVGKVKSQFCAETDIVQNRRTTVLSAVKVKPSRLQRKSALNSPKRGTRKINQRNSLITKQMRISSGTLTSRSKVPVHFVQAKKELNNSLNAQHNSGKKTPEESKLEPMIKETLSKVERVRMTSRKISKESVEKALLEKLKLKNIERSKKLLLERCGECDSAAEKKRVWKGGKGKFNKVLLQNWYKHMG
eukprot:TRINITY_DN11378_c0_g1_i5.p1 TRINITY_DN11378_c0_g1~~TRINITY_DN11378_c0_g1_i5.p1  ORF type:complete len:429 (-),score=49.46 TRINITY_DN11378_c0_g1_i5:106-1392(-)